MHPGRVDLLLSPTGLYLPPRGSSISVAMATSCPQSSSSHPLPSDIFKNLASYVLDIL